MRMDTTVMSHRNMPEGTVKPQIEVLKWRRLVAGSNLSKKTKIRKLNLNAIWLETHKDLDIV